MRYAFVLGREPALSIAELIALLKEADPPFDPKTGLYSPAVMVAETSVPLDEAWFGKLGGTIKMAEVLGDSADLENDLVGILSDLAPGAIDFGISLYPLERNYGKAYRSLERGLKAVSLTVKKRLKESGRSVRAVLPEGTALSSVQVDKNRLLKKGAELLLLVGEGRVLVARTLCVQDFEDFSRRDFGRPGRDAKSGMLPPKLARLMVNLSLAPKQEPLLDPFCGSGTVLTEAFLLGYRDLIGSDISPRAIADTRTNLEWTLKGDTAETRVFEADVKLIPQKLKPSSVAAIVSEPFLGPPLSGDESDQKIHFEYLELMGLYRRAFDAFSKVLRPGAPVVFVFPFFGSKHVNLLRDVESLGFKAENLLPGKAVEALALKTGVGLSYKRPDQLVGRDIFRFRFAPNA